MSEQQQQHEQDKSPGIVCWNELASTDPAASVDFYTKLLGWTKTTEDMGGGFEYTMFMTAEGKPAGGMIPMPEEAKGAPTMWMGYISVTNLEESVAKAQELGASIHKGITAMPMGRFAIVGDPQGAVFGLWQFTC